MLPTLSQIDNMKRFTNKSSRPTAIRYMKRGGATDRDITTVSGHNKESSLKHYDPYVTDDTAAGMANSIANAGLDVAKIPQNLPNPDLAMTPPPPEAGLSAKSTPQNHSNAGFSGFDLHDEFFNSQDHVSSIISYVLLKNTYISQ